MEDVLVLDNGSHSIKLAHASIQGVLQVPNCIARSKDDRRLYIGHQLDEKHLLATLQYRRPHERGYLTSWDTEKAIWDALLASEQCKEIQPDRHCLVLTEPPHNLPILQTNTDEIVFEEYRFSSYIRSTPAAFIPWGTLPTFRTESSAVCHEVVLVIDSGFSFTHITAVVNGVPRCTKRLDIGGKFLTNYLKETISFRQYNMMEETHLMNQVKEQCCFVSNDFKNDMELARQNKLVKKYVLPDFATNTPGYLATPDTIVTEDMQVLDLKYELFQVPELLFNPADVGSPQGGIAHGVMETIRDLSEPIKALCLENIVLIGGSVQFPGFEERLTTEVRALAPDAYVIRTWVPPNPVTFAAECAMRMSLQTGHMADTAITRSQYQESNKKITSRFNQTFADSSSARVASDSPQLSTLKRRESKYDETSERSDTPRSFSPDTESENGDTKEEQTGT